MDTSTRGARPSTLEYKRSMSITYGSQSMDISHSQAVVGQPCSSDEIAGMLLKRRGGFGKHMPNSWQLRYFTIRDGVMMYFEGDNSSHPRGRIDLRAVNCTFQLGLVFENAPTPFTLQIAPGGGEEKWKLCAENPEDLERWSMCIEKHVNDKNRREATTNIGSDDEYFIDDGEVEPRKRSNSAPRITFPRGTTASAESTAPPKSDSVKVIPVVTGATEAAQVNPKSKGVTRRRGLKLRSEAVTPPETIEMISCLVILNICVLMFKYSDTPAQSIFYFAVANVVVVRTLHLRACRVSRVSLALASANEQIHGSSLISNETKTHNTASIPDMDLLSDTGPVVVRSGPPVAGSSVQQVSTFPPNVPDHTWCRCDHRTFNVRTGPDYNRLKKKAPSSAPLYDAFAVDVFCTKTRLDHAAREIKLPDTTDIDTHNKFVPPLLVVQIQIPSDPPPMFGSVEDGPGWAILMYFKITEDTCKQLEDLNSASPAVKLFAQYCEKAPKDPAWRARFKVINFCSNLEEMGVPNMILSFNAKPVLIRRTGSIFVGPNYLEIDVHVHKFANLAKKSIHALSSRCGLMYMQIGFVVEGREDDELPESLFACVGVNRPQEERAEFLFDVPDEE